MIGAAVMRPRSLWEPVLSRARPVVLGLGRFLRSGFTPKSALPIIAPLGRGPTWGFARERLPVAFKSAFEGPPMGSFSF